MIYFRKYFSCDYYTMYLAIFFTFFTSFQNSIKAQQSSHKDVKYLQEYAVKYDLGISVSNNSIELKKVFSDRNGVIQVLSSKGLLKPNAGQFLHPGKLVSDISYRPIADKNIKLLSLYKNQFVYADDRVVLSNAWAGKLYAKHGLTNIKLIAGGLDFSFLLSDGKYIELLKDSSIISRVKADEEVLDILYDTKTNKYLVLSAESVSLFSEKSKSIEKIFSGNGFTCFALAKNNSEIYIGTHDGYIVIDAVTKKQKGEIKKELPSTNISIVNEIEGQIWFGSDKGAFRLNKEGKYDYFASKRWIPSDKIVDIQSGADHSILILTDKGLGIIHAESMSLYDKAMFYEKQVRQRHIRNGFNSTLASMTNGDIGTGSFHDDDNDGLWTSMYLAAEAFRYAVTHSAEALQNCRESFDAMERLYSINHIPGFPSRSFERTGYNKTNKPWRKAEEADWDWKSTTSSDEAIGHIFVFGVIAELVDDADLKKRSIKLIDTLMQHIVDHEWYMIDWDGKPTLWGRWNPEYVNARPIMVGDRKITASNITAMLQTAYHFTGKKIYKEKAIELLNKHGYLENLMRPMKQIDYAPEDADDLSKLLSNKWNHSDDEMYFLGYWGLFRYAFNDTLKLKFKKSILDHWEIERPEKEAAWNIFTAMTGVKNFDLKESIWYLQKYPLDMISWQVKNSIRKDIVHLPNNFRNQTIKEVLPPNELDISRHNANRFDLDGGDSGSAEYSAADIWLLPYWMGRYLKVIGAPEKIN